VLADGESSASPFGVGRCRCGHRPRSGSGTPFPLVHFHFLCALIRYRVLLQAPAAAPAPATGDFNSTAAETVQKVLARGKLWIGPDRKPGVAICKVPACFVPPPMHVLCNSFAGACSSARCLQGMIGSVTLDALNVTVAAAGYGQQFSASNVHGVLSFLKPAFSREVGTLSAKLECAVSIEVVVTSQLEVSAVSLPHLLLCRKNSTMS
jgi:hypothetical protein